MELLVNGAPATSVVLPPGRQVATLRLGLPASSWVAARTRRSTTGAIYVVVDGKPVRASASDTCYLVRYTDHLSGLVGSGRDRPRGGHRGGPRRLRGRARRAREALPRGGRPGVLLRSPRPLRHIGPRWPCLAPSPRRARTARPLASADAGLQIEHTPPACLLADRVPRLVACLVPRSSKAALRVFFHAPRRCRGLLEPAALGCALLLGAPSAALRGPPPGSSYWFEAQGPGWGARSAEHAGARGDRCGGLPRPSRVDSPRSARPGTRPPERRASRPGSRARWPRRARRATAAPRPALPAAPARPAATTVAPRRPGGPARARQGPRPPAPARAARRPRAAATGSATSRSWARASRPRAEPRWRSRRTKTSGGPATTAGSGLPPTGVSGVYVGTETVNYPGGCVGTDDVVLNLQEPGGLLSGVLTFTVRTCACCSAGRGANPVSGLPLGHEPEPRHPHRLQLLRPLRRQPSRGCPRRTRGHHRHLDRRQALTPTRAC